MGFDSRRALQGMDKGREVDTLVADMVVADIEVADKQQEVGMEYDEKYEGRHIVEQSKDSPVDRLAEQAVTFHSARVLLLNMKDWEHILPPRRTQREGCPWQAPLLTFGQSPLQKHSPEFG